MQEGRRQIRAGQPGLGLCTDRCSLQPDCLEAQAGLLSSLGTCRKGGNKEGLLEEVTPKQNIK